MSEQDQLAAVFVHGFASNAKTWKSFGDRIAEDDELKSVDVLPLEYSTRLPRSCFLRPDRRLPTLSTVADLLQSFLETEAADYQRIVLVCHSMGGLVVQRYLQRMLHQGRGMELTRIRHVVLFATPNMGSDFARKWRRDLLGSSHPQEQDLRTLNEEIRDTHADVIRDVVNAETAGERTCPIPFSVYAGTDDNIVLRASAQGSFPKAGALPGDHFSIIKPTSGNHSSYTTLRRLLMEAVADSDLPAQAAVTTGSIDFPGRRVQYETTPSTVIVSELRTDFYGTHWEGAYHDVREQLSSASISVVDKRAYPDAAVDVLITVRSADVVLQPNSSAKEALLKVHSEHMTSGGKIFVGICIVGEYWRDAKGLIIHWLPPDTAGSFYVEGVPDTPQLYAFITQWIQAAIKSNSPRMRDGSRIDRMLDLAPDPYEIPGRNSL